MRSKLGRQKMKDSGPVVSVMRWSRCSRSECMGSGLLFGAELLECEISEEEQF